MRFPRLARSPPVTPQRRAISRSPLRRADVGVGTSDFLAGVPRRGVEERGSGDGGSQGGPVGPCRDQGRHRGVRVQHRHGRARMSEGVRGPRAGRPPRRAGHAPERRCWGRRFIWEARDARQALRRYGVTAGQAWRW